MIIPDQIPFMLPNHVSALKDCLYSLVGKCHL